MSKRLILYNYYLQPTNHRNPEVNTVQREKVELRIRTTYLRRTAGESPFPCPRQISEVIISPIVYAAIHVPLSPSAGGYNIFVEDGMNPLSLDEVFRLLAIVTRVSRRRRNDIRPLICRVMDVVDLP